jgi:hypothetical protein
MDTLTFEIAKAEVIRCFPRFVIKEARNQEEDAENTERYKFFLFSGHEVIYTVYDDGSHDGWSVRKVDAGSGKGTTLAQATKAYNKNVRKNVEEGYGPILPEPVDNFEVEILKARLEVLRCFPNKQIISEYIQHSRYFFTLSDHISVSYLLYGNISDISDWSVQLNHFQATNRSLPQAIAILEENIQSHINSLIKAKERLTK